MLVHQRVSIILLVVILDSTIQKIVGQITILTRGIPYYSNQCPDNLLLKFP